MTNTITTSGEICNNLELTVTGNDTLVGEVLDLLDVSAFDGYVASYVFDLNGALQTEEYHLSCWNFEEDT